MTHSAQYIQENFDHTKKDFLEHYPQYNQPKLDELRHTEYQRLDANQQIYLDYTGGGLYAQSQLDQHFAMLRDGVWGNPHSHNPTSQAMTDLVERARDYVLTYLNADPAEYDVVFTQNASAALKIVGEAYPFHEGGRYLAIYDNHNSVNGIREFARAKGATVNYVPTRQPDLRLRDVDMEAALSQADQNANNLFAYPAQSNFTGVKHDLEWIKRAHHHGWDVMLDAAAFMPTNHLDLSQHKPEFVSISFYKIFGYPTGIGALIAKRDALARLQKPWFAGGTITVISVQGEGWHYLIDGHAAFEDGTVNYLSIPAIENGLRYIESVGIDTIQDRVMALTGWLIENMMALTHDNGQTFVKIHGPENTVDRGGTIAFHLDDPQGKRLHYRNVELLANEAHISLRTGCFCNPGSGEIAYEVTTAEMQTVFSEANDKLTFDGMFKLFSETYAKYPSSIRVSVGIASNFEDVYALMRFLTGLLNRPAAEINAPTIEAHTTPDTA